MNPQPERIILTGASSGMGRAMAIEYARRGARLVLIARREQLLDEVVGIVQSHGGRAVALATDVSAEGAAARAMQLAESEYGGVDTLIMNAAIGSGTWVEKFHAEEVERVMEVNYTANVRFIEAVLPRMLAQGHGRIVAVTSLAGYRGMPGAGAYNASKMALSVMMASLRTELRGSGITLTIIAPGFVHTELNASNEFYMPFEMTPEKAAHRMIRAIDAGRSEYRFPLPTSLLVRLVQLMPNPVYDRAISWGRKIGAVIKSKM